MTEWTTACPDWTKRILRGESLIPVPLLFPDEAAASLAVFRELRIVDAPGGPTMGEACRPWIIDFVGSVFGAYDPEIGRRLITEFFLLISKKNAKSTTAAGIMLTALIRNWRESAEFLILAPTVEIANNSFYPARDMVRKDEELSDLFHVQDHVRTITHRGNGAQLKVVAADNETVGGKKATGVLVDELWLFGKQPNAENMLREACGGLASRPEGFTIFLSTQSDYAPAGIFRQKLQYARDVRDGVVQDKRFLPVLYEFPPEMVKSRSYRDPKKFFITNPNLGASVDPEFLEREFRKADNAGPESMSGFLSKHLNVEIGLALGSDRWPGAEFWELQAIKLTLAALIARCEVITVGIDGGGLDDLLGLAITGREKGTGKWLSWMHAWAHPSVLERRKSEAGRFHDFERDGDLTLVSKVGHDTAQVADYVAQVVASGKLDKIGIDPYAIGSIMDELSKIHGLEAEKITAISQGWRLTGAIKTTERKLAEEVLFHHDSPMMNWCVGNAKIEPRGNAILVTKQASGRAKVDPLMALFNSIELMALNPEAPLQEHQLFFI